MTFDTAACLLAIRRSTPSCCEWECAIVTKFGYGPPPRKPLEPSRSLISHARRPPLLLRWCGIFWIGPRRHSIARHIEKAVVQEPPFTVDSIVSLLLTMGSDLLVRLGHRESRLVNSKTCTIASIHANFQRFLEGAAACRWNADRP